MTWKEQEKGSKMIEMNVVAFILMVVLFLALAVAAFLVGALGGMVYQKDEDEKKSNSTEIIKFEN